MAYNNHEYGNKGTYRQHMECLNTSWLTSNHEYGSKSTYRQHMEHLMGNNHAYGNKKSTLECLNTSWLTTIMSTAARVSIVNTWNA